MTRPFLVFASVAVLTCTVWGQSTQDLQSRIHEVENGLVPPVVVTGQPPVRKTLLQEMEERHVPAVSVAVIHGGKIEWAKGYGVVREGGAPVTPETLFQAASISKSLTATAALHLVEAGKLSLDAPIQTELKSWTLPQNSFTAQQPVTLRELLSHTAGTTVHGFKGYASGEPVPTLVQVLNGQKPANSDPIVVSALPGKAFSYSGGGFTIMQQAVIDAIGEPFPATMKKLVLGPAGMTNSTYQQPLDPKLLPKVAMPVNEKGVPIVGGPYTYPEMAAAGLWTTPTDLSKWIIEMQQSLVGKANHILTTSMTRTMLTPVQSDYGLGVETRDTNGRRSFSHSGSNVGYRAYYIGYEDGDGAVIMTNSENGSPLAMDLVRSIAHVYDWPDFKQTERTAVTLPPASLTPYVGKFTATNMPDFEVLSRGDQLLFVIRGDSQPLLASAPAHFFTTETTMEVRFNSPDSGAVIFGKLQLPFTRTK